MTQIRNKAVFLDKDGTLVDNSGYPSIIPADKLLADAVVDGLRYLQQKGYKLFIISNQPWISKGLLTKEQVEKIFCNLLTELKNHHVDIDGYYYCPHQQKDGCNCKKPKIKLIEQAAKEHSLDLQNSFFIGDMETDISAGKNAKMKTILVQTGNGKKYGGLSKPDFIIKNINGVDEVVKK